MDHPITRSIGPCNTGNVATIPREISACRVDWVGSDSRQAETPEPPRPEGFCSRTVGFEPTTSWPLRRLNDEGSRLLMRKRHWAASSRPSRPEYHSPLPKRDHRYLNGHSNQERVVAPVARYLLLAHVARSYEPDNTAARSLYQSMGLVGTGETEGTRLSPAFAAVDREASGEIPEPSGPPG